MQRFQNLIFIGTSHIAKQSILEVEEIITQEQPEVVALELDKGRFYGLLQNKRGRIGLKEIRLLGVKGYLFVKLGEFVERKLGNKVGIRPGQEMLKAAEIASKYKCKIALIDQKIEVTLKRFSKEITWKEKFRFVEDLFKGFFFGGEKIAFDLTKVPEKEVIHKMITYVRERYPNLYKVLIEERNNYMAAKLAKLMPLYSKIVVVIGAGHEEEIIEEIRKLLLSKQ